MRAGLRQPLAVDRLERLVVHVEEAVRLGTAEHEASVRLGLILIDSAAELLMHRETEYVVAWSASLYDGWLETAEQLFEITGEGEAELAELRAKVISKTRRKKIDREFDMKCDFLVEQGTLAEPHARALKKLHIYRNETYHRDGLRPGTLANAVKIYIYLVCTMMKTFPVHSMTWGPALASTAKYLEPDASNMGFDTELQARIGQQLMVVTRVDKPMDLGNALAEHVTYRLDAIEAAVDECASFFEAMNPMGWDDDAILGLVQAPEPDDKHEHLGRTVGQFRAWAKPVNMAQINAWRVLGEGLTEEADDLAAFTAFADIEDAFEPIEKLITKLALEVDREIQHQVDVARGK